MNAQNMALQYADLGWRIVKLHGVAAGGCTCSRGSDCPSAGKHPVGTDWPSLATNSEEEIQRWFEESKGVNFNIGLLLGPASGVIDVELDDEEAKASWRRHVQGEIHTPTYIGSRGPHRLFKWSDDLPSVAVKKVDSLEIRLGAGSRAAQSVLPPSTHASGRRYTWIEGLDPSSVPLAELPENLKTLLWNEETGFGVQRSPATLILGEKIREGGRNEALHRYACRLCSDMAATLERIDVQKDVLERLQEVNASQCVPPLPAREVEMIFRSAAKFIFREKVEERQREKELLEQQQDEADELTVKLGAEGAEEAGKRLGRSKLAKQRREQREKKKVADKLREENPLGWKDEFEKVLGENLQTGKWKAATIPGVTVGRPKGSTTAAHVAAGNAAGLAKLRESVLLEYGLELKNWEFYPGTWYLTIHDGDEKKFVLTNTDWITEHSANPIILTVIQLKSAALTAEKILAATGRVVVDRDRDIWKMCWEGGYKVPGSEGKASPLWLKLIDDSETVVVKAEHRRSCRIAAILYANLMQGDPYDPEKHDLEPNALGGARWVAPDRVAFEWSIVWGFVDRSLSKGVSEAEGAALTAKVIERAGPTAIETKIIDMGGVKKVFQFWSKKAVMVVCDIAHGL